MENMDSVLVMDNFKSTPYIDEIYNQLCRSLK